MESVKGLIHVADQVKVLVADHDLAEVKRLDKIPVIEFDLIFWYLAREALKPVKGHADVVNHGVSPMMFAMHMNIFHVGIVGRRKAHEQGLRPYSWAFC